MFRQASGKKEEEDPSKINSLFAPLPLTYDKENVFQNRYMTKLDLDAWEAKTIRGKQIDRRVEYVIGLGNFETGQTFTATREWGVGWAGPKFWCPDMENTYDSNNYRVFRYADAVLMKAEALANLGDWTCKEYLQQVRSRAGVAESTPEFADFTSFLDYIRDERARELGGEFMRKFDLVRWGIWFDVIELVPHSNYDSALPCHRYYPIPDKQCALSGYNLTNPEYENSEAK